MMTTDDLRAWRARRRWSQEQAADALGYSRRGYQDAENRPSGEAITPRLEDRVRAVDMPVRSMEGTTLGDLTIESNVREAQIELERAMTDEEFARWARRWGRCAVTALFEIVEDEGA